MSQLLTITGLKSFYGASQALHGVDLDSGFADQLDLHENRQRPPDAGRVQNRDIRGDNARRLHSADASLDRGRGQVDRRADFALRRGVVTLQDTQNRKIEGIKGGHMKQTCTN